MNASQRGFLLLSSHLGDPERKPLTPAQLRILTQRCHQMDVPEGNRELCREDLLALGYRREMADRILGLLSQEMLLDRYLRRAQQAGCSCVTRVDPEYPLLLRRRLGEDSPGCLWLRGDRQILNTPAIALVGSRELRQENRHFAREVGIQAAQQGLTLVSGNARGADRTAQDACFQAGGQVISIVADALESHPLRERYLYVSEDSFELPFSAQRAISRNRLIHGLGRMVFVAQATLESGGTWDGTAKNLHHGWSPVACFRDGSEASRRLEQMGAYLVETADMDEIGEIGRQDSFFEP